MSDESLADLEVSSHWGLDPSVLFLNHGSFGACPRPVLALQQILRERMEQEPVRFLGIELEPLWDEARASLAAFIGSDPADVVFVPNATTGVNTVLASLRFSPGDELLVTDQEYNACRNALEEAARRTGARVVVAALPFPAASPEEAVEAILRRATERTRLLLVDHVVSQTALVMPVAALVREMAARGVETLVDGAHGPGMLPLDLTSLGAAYYTGNCHKWLCAPKGAALLHVRRDLQPGVRPLVISHGANSPRADRSRFLLEFGWTGTHDPTPYLCVPEAIRFLGSLLPGGWPEVMARNRALALRGRRLLCGALRIAEPCPESMVGSMAAVPLPDAPGPRPQPPLFLDPLQVALWERYCIEVPVIYWPAFPCRVLRLSVQLYNEPAHYERLAEAVKGLLDEGF
ncbi:MAG: aminotransferase class V-fold PLP-dependent enzyme [Acidobacteriota bacterium]